MELMQAIRQRRAVREYTQETVAPTVINRLIEAATLAPSAVNCQPWQFTVIRDRGLLDRISVEAKKFMLSVIDSHPGHEGFREHLTNPDFQIFYHAPALILISAAREDMWASEDTALAAENLMLAACSEGLGTCWIGFSQRWLETEAGRRTVDVAAQYRPIAPIIVGHPRHAVAAAPAQCADHSLDWLTRYTGDARKEAVLRLRHSLFHGNGCGDLCRSGVVDRRQSSVDGKPNLLRFRCPGCRLSFGAIGKFRALLGKQPDRL